MEISVDVLVLKLEWGSYCRPHSTKQYTHAVQPPPTRHPPTTPCTHQPPTTHRPTHNSSAAAVRTAVHRYTRSMCVVPESRRRYTRNAGRLLFLRSPDTPGSELSTTKHPPPTTHSPTYRPPQYNSSTAGGTDQSTRAAQQQCSSTQHSSTPGTRECEDLGGDFYFRTIFRLPGGECQPSPG